MNIIFYILFLSIPFSQDRSTLFSTGNPPELGEGWDVRCSELANDEIGDINQDGNADVLDVVSIVGFILGNSVPSEEEATLADTNYDGSVDVLDVVAIVSIILNGNPGGCLSGYSAAVKFYSSNEYTFEAFSVIFETGDFEGDGLFEVMLHEDANNTPGDVIGSWNLNLDENIAREYYVFTGDTDCILLTTSTYYWLSVHPVDNVDEALWLFSEDDYTYAESTDMGATWSETLSDQVGCTKIYGEQIYESSFYEPSAEQVYDWSLEDINSNSEYYAQHIGPSTFFDSDNVSVYYFGKAG